MEIRNVGQPGKTYRVNAAKFRAMQSAVLAVLPDGVPGMAVADLVRGVVPLLPKDLFPGGQNGGLVGQGGTPGPGGKGRDRAG